jgi:hypothetical protein
MYSIKYYKDVSGYNYQRRPLQSPEAVRGGGRLLRVWAAVARGRQSELCPRGALGMRRGVRVARWWWWLYSRRRRLRCNGSFIVVELRNADDCSSSVR